MRLTGVLCQFEIILSDYKHFKFIYLLPKNCRRSGFEILGFRSPVEEFPLSTRKLNSGHVEFRVYPKSDIPWKLPCAEAPRGRAFE